MKRFKLLGTYFSPQTTIFISLVRGFLQFNLGPWFAPWFALARTNFSIRESLVLRLINWFGFNLKTLQSTIEGGDFENESDLKLCCRCGTKLDVPQDSRLYELSRSKPVEVFQDTKIWIDVVGDIRKRIIMAFLPRLTTTGFLGPVLVRFNDGPIIY